MGKSTEQLSWAEISSLAGTDLEFRQLLIDNPRQAIETKFNITLPKDVDYIVHEQSAETVHLVLPPLLLSLSVLVTTMKRSMPSVLVTMMKRSMLSVSATTMKRLTLSVSAMMTRRSTLSVSAMMTKNLMILMLNHKHSF